jgi:hypothetical protein
MGEVEIAREYAAKQPGGTLFDFAFGFAGTSNVVGAFGWLKSENREDLEYCCEKVIGCAHASNMLLYCLLNSSYMCLHAFVTNHR